MRVRRRGFSLLELSIAMAMAGIVVAAAASSGVTIGRLLKLDSKKSTADQDARRLVDFILGTMQGVGGAAVRPWMGLWLEQQDCGTRAGLPACDGSDRLTMVDVDFARSSCEVVAVTANTVSLVGAGGACCYDWDGTPVGGELNQYEGQVLMFVRGRNLWAARVATTETDRTTCTFGLTGVNPLDGWVAPTGSPANSAPVADADFVATFGADTTVTAVRIRTLFVEQEPTGGTRLPRLVEWQDGTTGASINNVVDTGEVRLVFPGVMSFQVALGYDSVPDDGRVIDLGTTSDEWFGNVATDAATGLAATGLRMGQVGVVTGVKAVDPGARTLQVLDGAPVPSGTDLILRRGVGRALLRNVAVFF